MDKFTQHYMTLTPLDVIPLLWIWGDDSERCGAEKEKHAFVCLLLSAHVQLSGHSAPS